MKPSKYFVVFSCLLVSCSGIDDITDNVSDSEIRNAVVRIEPFLFDGSETRTDLTYKDNVIKFSWDDDETIGVFPIAPYSGSQAYKHLERSGDDGHVATFDGGGWKIRPNATYSAYYPYNGKLTNETTFDKIPVSLKRQVQDGYNNLAHIGRNYDYMCATATAPSKGDIEFNFKHITSVVQLEVTLPEAGVISKVIIFDKQHEPVFVDSAMLNVNTREVTPVHKSSMVELGVKNGTELKANEKVLFYVAMLPMTKRLVDITIEMQDGKCYEATYKPKNVKGGYAYRWSISPESAGEHVGVDLGLSVRWATMNVGAKNPSGNGNYYAWGETVPQSSKAYDWSSYKWCNGTDITLTKYCLYSSSGTVDNKTTLETEDDAATQNWGSAWRMPTITEIKELFNNCYWVWTSSYNGNEGYFVYKAKSLSDMGQVISRGKTALGSYSLSDAHIFLPAAGFGDAGSSVNVRDQGIYWSSCSDNYIDGNEVYVVTIDFNCYRRSKGFSDRCCGLSVRAVCE